MAGIIPDLLKHTRLSRLILEKAVMESLGCSAYERISPLLEGITDLEIKIEAILFPVNDTLPPQKILHMKHTLPPMTRYNLGRFPKGF